MICAEAGFIPVCAGHDVRMKLIIKEFYLPVMVLVLAFVPASAGAQTIAKASEKVTIALQ